MAKLLRAINGMPHQPPRENCSAWHLKNQQVSDQITRNMMPCAESKACVPSAELVMNSLLKTSATDRLSGDGSAAWLKLGQRVVAPCDRGFAEAESELRGHASVPHAFAPFIR